MKFLSWVALIAIAAWTFQLSQQSQALPIRVHGFLVQELQKVMTNYLESHVEGVQNITFHRLFTEEVEPAQKLKAYVKYSYESYMENGSLTRELREGEFDLVSSDGGLTWEPTAKNFRELNLEFLDGLRVVPGETEEAAQGESSPLTE